MCSIAGILQIRADSSTEELRQRVQGMLDLLQHRGPDGQDIWLDASTGIALGHCRLKIMDHGEAGRQPKASPTGRYIASFNGEIYNFRQLRQQLEGLGHHFAGQGDAEVLVASLEQWGVAESLARFDGMFALAVWDRSRQELILARDALGEKPLYYGRVDNALVFASDLAALRKYPGMAGGLDHQALRLYLQYGCVPAPHSILAEVRKLMPGTFLRVGAQSALGCTEVYWTVGATHPPLGDPLDRIHELLKSSVRERLQAEVPVGLFLSGGIDSSLVAALAQSQSSQPLHSFTIGFSDPSIDEAPYAREIARHLGCDHHELYLGDAQALAQVQQLRHIYQEPFADSSQIATSLVAQLARQQVGVVLTGDGSDELFFGYKRYQATMRRWKGPTSWLPRLRRRLRGLSVTPNTLAGLYRELTTLAFVSPQSVLRSPAPLPFASPPPSQLSDHKLLSYMDLGHYLPNDILTKVDRATMAVALEARSPFLARPLVEYAFSLPSQLGSEKLLLRQVLAKYLPACMFERPKQGFMVPLGGWLRGPLRDWAQDLLASDRLRRQGLFRPAAVQKIWRAHLEGAEGLHHKLWAILMFQQWMST